MIDGNCFAAPDEFGTALPETPPAAKRVFTWLAVVGAVPAFHRVDGDAVADFKIAAVNRLEQRGGWPMLELFIAGDVQAKLLQIRFEL